MRGGAAFFPQGPIEAGAACMIGHWDSASILYVLTDVSTLPGNNPYNSSYIFERAVSFNPDGSLNINDGISDRIAVFKTGGSTSSFTLSQSLPSPDGYFGYTLTSTSVPGAYANKNTILAPNIQASQNNYSEWGDPVIFLAGAPYQFTTIPSSSPSLPSPPLPLSSPSPPLPSPSPPLPLPLPSPPPPLLLSLLLLSLPLLHLLY